MDNELKLLSFFTGLGLLDLGFIRAKYKFTWYTSFANAFQFAMKSYLGYDIKNLNRNSIVDIDPGQVVREAFGKKHPEFFGIIGGPPLKKDFYFFQFP